MKDGDVIADNEFPPVLRERQLIPARAVLASCPPGQRRLVLQELAAIAARGAVRRSPLGLLRKLVECANDGTFVSSGRIDTSVDSMFKRSMPVKHSAEGKKSGPVQSSEIASRALAAIRKKLNEGN